MSAKRREAVYDRTSALNKGEVDNVQNLSHFRD
jgi:hypothetical protein